MNEPTVRLKVKPTNITGQSLLVVPNSDGYPPYISIQMETIIAKRLAHAANTLPELVKAARDFYNEADATSAAADRLHDALAAAEKVKELP